MAVSTSTAHLFDVGSQNRVLWVCVTVSIVLHSLVLWLSPRSHKEEPASAVQILTATIIAPRAAAPEPAVAVPEPVVKTPEPVRPKPEVKPPPERPVLTRPTPEPSAPRVAQEPTPPAPVQAPAPAPPPPPVQAAPAAPSPPVAARAPEAQSPAQSAAPNPDAATIGQYRIALLAAARGFKLYPRAAMENGWTGTVEVRVTVGATGFVRSTAVKTSSGHDVLDNQALDMVRRGQAKAPIPPGLRGKEFNVDIPVVFDLQNG